MTETARPIHAETSAALEATIRDMIAACGAEKTINPAEAAQALAGKAGDAWGALMPAVRKIAVRLAKEGRLTIYRKGKQVDPNDFKGVYRLGPVRED